MGGEGTRRKPAYSWFAFPALILLLGDLLWPHRRRLRAAGLILTLICLCPGLYGSEGLDDFREGVRFYRAKNFEAARIAFEKAAGKEADNPDLQVNLGLTHLRLNEVDQAARCFSRAMQFEESPANDAARFGLGLARFRRGERALAVAQELKGIDAAKILKNALEEMEAAAGLFSEIIESGPWPDEAAHNLALSSRMKETILGRLKRLEKEKGSSKEGKTETSHPGEGTETGEGDPTRVEAKGTEEKKGETSDKELDKSFKDPLTWEEREEIFKRLREMERKRMALEKETRKSRKKTEGERDW